VREVNFSPQNLSFTFGVPVGVLGEFGFGFFDHHLEGGVVGVPGAGFPIAVGHFGDLGFDFAEVAAVDVQRIGDIDIAADADGAADFFADPAGDDASQIGQGIDVHEPGLVEVSAAPVGVHVQDRIALLVFDNSEPQPLEAGWVVGVWIGGGHPGDGLGAAGIEGFAAFVDDVFNLVDRLERLVGFRVT
jgi:hypothetical protein